MCVSDGMNLDCGLFQIESNELINHTSNWLEPVFQGYRVQASSVDNFCKFHGNYMQYRRAGASSPFFSTYCAIASFSKRLHIQRRKSKMNRNLDVMWQTCVAAVCREKLQISSCHHLLALSVEFTKLTKKVNPYSIKSRINSFTAIWLSLK